MSDEYSGNRDHDSGCHDTSCEQTGLPQSHQSPFAPPNLFVNGPGDSGVGHNHQACSTSDPVPPNHLSSTAPAGNNETPRRLAKGFYTGSGRLTDKKSILEYLFSKYPSTRTDATWIAYVWYCPFGGTACRYWSPQKSNLEIHAEKVHGVTDFDFEQQKQEFVLTDRIPYWRHRDENLLLIEKFKDIRPENIPLRSSSKPQDSASLSTAASTSNVNVMLLFPHKLKLKLMIMITAATSLTIR
ncbi:hypothetical protein QCA50_006144 [Cerrena zonata]|uniref:Uncharacterized protein n=1 Tax=Cerrena zonata TaxID=2478898 RepID=A0AAW0GCE7_9APHY